VAALTDPRTALFPRGLLPVNRQNGCCGSRCSSRPFIGNSFWEAADRVGSI